MPDTILKSSDSDGFVTLTLNRPDIHNAFNEALMAQLTEALESLGNDDQVRGVVLTGAGKSFSAGADLNWMGAMIGADEAENRADAPRLAKLLRLLNFLPKPTLARVNGAAFGGGIGLIACCDIAIATPSGRFGLTEVKLGLVPAVISPYVLRKIGERNARRFFLTGESFTASQAEAMGLIHAVTSPEQLDSAIVAQKQRIARAGPHAVRYAKQLIQNVSGQSPENQESLDQATAQLIAQLRVTKEAQEGMAAFLDKRDPDWALKSDRV